MALATCQAILGLGIFFILFGVASMLFSRREEKKYNNSILTQRDIKELITREPEQPWLRGWEIGGKISLIVGVPLAITGGVLWLTWY